MHLIKTAEIASETTAEFANIHSALFERYFSQLTRLVEKISFEKGRRTM